MGTNEGHGARTNLALPLMHSWGRNHRIHAFQKEVLKMFESEADEVQKVE
jgi:hypothetical protein